MELTHQSSLLVGGIFLIIFVLPEIPVTYCLDSDSGQSEAKSKEDLHEAKAVQGSDMSWIDLDMKFDDSAPLPEKISELNLVFNFEDEDTPPSKMTIMEPNLTSQNGKIILKQMGENDSSSNNMTVGNSSLIMPTMRVYFTNMTSPDKHTNSTTTIDTSSEPSELKERSCSCSNIDEIVEELAKRKFMLKGDKGEPGEIPEVIKNLDFSKLKGERGPPGYCSRSECPSTGGDELRSGWPPFPQPTPSHRYPVPPQNLYKIVPGALVFPTRRAMLQMKEFSFVGTVAFVESDQIFYGRVENGWRSFLMGSHVHRSVTPPPRRIVADTPSASIRLQEHKRKPETVATKPIIQSRFPQRDNTETLSSYQQDAKIPQITLPTVSAKKETVKPKYSELSTSQSLSSSEKEAIHTAQISSPPQEQSYMTSRRLITLNSLQSGNMGGINQVNYQCQKQAMKANLFGIFKALLDLSSITTINNNSKLTIVNMLNETILTLNDGISSESSHLSAPIYSFSGRMIIPISRGPSRLSWMGSHNTGNSCHGWTSASPEDSGTVFRLSSSGLMPTSDEVFAELPCNLTSVVFCIEILPWDKTHLRHFGNSASKKKNGIHNPKPRLSFEKYLSILRAYENAGNKN